MKLIMTLLVRDEEDILRANIDFHLGQGVDHIIATDNRSCDKTCEILHHYERQGVLSYIYEGSDDYSQHRWVTRMATVAFQDHDADWVINNDADEFWYPEHDNSLKDVLARVPPEISVVSAERVNFIPRVDQEDRPFYEFMVIRETTSVNTAGQLRPKVCHRALPGIEVEQGNHAVWIHGEVLESVPIDIRILHFPLRSYRQFENKIAKGGQAYENNKELPEGMGWTWRRLFDLYKSGKLRAYYKEQVLSDAAVQSGLANGSLVEDRRIFECLCDPCGMTAGCASLDR